VSPEGRHLLLDLFGCAPEPLNDAALLQRLLTVAAEQAGAQIVAQVFHPFSPHGVTGVVVISESHLSIHTWPELGYAALDFYTCGSADAEAALTAIARALRAGRAELVEVRRGEPNGGRLGVERRPLSM
jgi:S-adenosylmethionine decarboxylase proenzyme